MNPSATPSSEPAPIIEARRLSRTYRIGDREVVGIRDVDLTVAEGELLLLLSPNAHLRCHRRSGKQRVEGYGFVELTGYAEKFGDSMRRRPGKQ